MPRKYASLQERIIANTVSSDMLAWNGTPCWIWTGKRNSTGYGVINIRFRGGPRKGKVKSALVHRVVLRVFKGRKLTTKSVGRHLCNMKPCCNPEHLVGGSQRTNMRQCVAEGRHGNMYRAPVAAQQAAA